MSQYLTELCTLLVEDTFGALFAHIFSTLAIYGRLESTQLAQKCRLPLRHIRHSLSVLVQAHLVYHHTSSDQRTSYEADFQAAYNLIRSGKIIHLAKQNLGDDAALIVTYILSVCQVTMRDLHSFWTDSHGNHNLQNGEIEDGHRGSTARNSTPQPEIHARREPGRNDLIHILKQLVQSGFVLRSRRAHFHTFADNYFDAQSELRSLEDGTAAKNRKSQHELSASITDEIERRNNASITLANFEGITTVSKRSATEDSESVVRKKTKLTHVASTGLRTNACKSAPDDNSVAETFTIRINHDKVAAMIRNRRLIDKARRTIGRSAAQTYGVVLQQSTAISYRWQRGLEAKPEDEDPTSNSHPVDQGLLLRDLKEQNLYGHDDGAPAPSSVSHGSTPSVDSYTYANGYVNGNHSIEAAPTVTISDIKKYLLILAQSPHKFVVQDPDSFCWTVDFQELSVQLRRDEALRLARSRLNGVALRLVRVLIDKGKLDEKTLQEMSLLSAKDLRQCLGKLKMTGFLGLQEIPREPQRQPLRTIYLWFYDSDRVRKMLLEDLYKAMSRLLQRLKVERDKVGPLLEKAERIDVRIDEKKFLAGGEVRVLDEWRRKEEWLLGEVERLDDSVAILRDI